MNWPKVLSGLPDDELRVALMMLADELDGPGADYLREHAGRLRPFALERVRAEDGRDLMTYWKRPCWVGESWREYCHSSTTSMGTQLARCYLAGDLYAALRDGSPVADTKEYATHEAAWAALLKALRTSQAP